MCKCKKEIYIVVLGTNYEGYNTVNIYDNLDDAEKERDRVVDEYNITDSSMYYSNVQTWVV